VSAHAGTRAAAGCFWHGTASGPGREPTRAAAAARLLLLDAQPPAHGLRQVRAGLLRHLRAAPAGQAGAPARHIPSQLHGAVKRRATLTCAARTLRHAEPGRHERGGITENLLEARCRAALTSRTKAEGEAGGRRACMSRADGLNFTRTASNANRKPASCARAPPPLLRRPTRLRTGRSRSGSGRARGAALFRGWEEPRSTLSRPSISSTASPLHPKLPNTPQGCSRAASSRSTAPRAVCTCARGPERPPHITHATKALRGPASTHPSVCKL